jgi:hypothetical protein
VASDFDIPLSRPVILKTGRVLRTLGDGVVFIGELSEFPDLRPAWHRACATIGVAASTGDASDVETATRELAIALAQDGLLDGPRRPRGNGRG